MTPREARATPREAKVIQAVLAPMSKVEMGFSEVVSIAWRGVDAEINKSRVSITIMMKPRMGVSLCGLVIFGNDF